MGSEEEPSTLISSGVPEDENEEDAPEPVSVVIWIVLQRKKIADSVLFKGYPIFDILAQWI